MFLGYQDNKIKFYTEERLDETFYNLDRVEETEDVYVLSEDGTEYVLYDDTQKAIELAKAKEAKQEENVAKCDEKRFNQTFNIILQEQECEFDTSSKTQSDLMAAGLVTATGATYDNWVCNNGVVINLSTNDLKSVFEKFFGLVSSLYEKQLEYSDRINACTTLEEISLIRIDYDEL